MDELRKILDSFLSFKVTAGDFAFFFSFLKYVSSSSDDFVTPGYTWAENIII